MPSDSNLNDLPPSPIENDDLWLINRDDKSYKVTSAQLGSFLAQIEVPEVCQDDTDCPSGKVCVDGYCERIPCDRDDQCPPNHVCYLGYCYPTCDLVNNTPCTEGHICVDPGITGGIPICLPYPFPCDVNELPPNGCPNGYECWGDYCWHKCIPGDANFPCPPGMECVESNASIGFICVPPEGGFPCADGACPEGFDCFFGMCFAKCGPGSPNGGVCGDGFQCITIGGFDYCVPYPFPCDLYGAGCPPNMYCYGGQCYPLCTADADCEPDFECLQIGTDNSNNPIKICYPTNPPEGYINDGKLNFVDDQSNYLTVFTANQYGDTYLRFSGIDIDPGSEEGGGSGAAITFNTLWERTDESKKDSDVRPRYTNVNALPKGSESNLGYPAGQNTTPSSSWGTTSGTYPDAWKSVYTHSLRDVDTAGDHIATGTTAQRPTTKPEGGAITAGEIRFNTNRGVERFNQSRHSKDFEVYNGSQWVRMDTKAEGPLYDDNAETRLIYGRGLTTGNSGANPSGNGADASIKSWAGYKTYNVPQLEAKIGRGLRFGSNGEVEQFANDGDDITILHNPVYIKRNQGQRKVFDTTVGGIGNGKNGFEGGTLRVPAGCNRGIITFEHKLELEAHDAPLDIDTGTGFPYELADSLEEYRNNRLQLRVANPINFAWINANPQFTMTNANIIQIDAAGNESIGGNLIGFSQSLNVVEEVGKKGNGGFWTSKSEMIQITGSSIVCDFTMPWDAYNVYKGGFGIYRVFLTPYES